MDNQVKTFIINGEEYPAPGVKDNAHTWSFYLSERDFWFETYEDRNRVKDALFKLLEG